MKKYEINLFVEELIDLQKLFQAENTNLRGK